MCENLAGTISAIGELQYPDLKMSFFYALKWAISPNQVTDCIEKTRHLYQSKQTQLTKHLSNVLDLLILLFGKAQLHKYFRYNTEFTSCKALKLSSLFAFVLSL